MVAALAVAEKVEGQAVMGVWSEGVFFPIDEAGAGDAGAA